MICVQCGNDHETHAPCVYPDRCDCGGRIASVGHGGARAKRCGVNAECRRKTAQERERARREAKDAICSPS